MFEPVSRGVSQDVFRHHSVLASKFLDSYSMFDWGRMPDGIPHRGKFQFLMQAYLNLKMSSVEEWKNFLRSPDALALRKKAPAAAHFNELADYFPMKSSDLGIINESNFVAGKVESSKLTLEMIQSGEPHYLLNDSYPEVKPSLKSVLGNIVWDFTEWKKKSGPKALPFEFECDFISDFPNITLHCEQNAFSTVVSFTEALLITEIPAEKLEEAILRAAWIAGFVQFQMKRINTSDDQKKIRIKMGIVFTESSVDFVFLGTTVEFSDIAEELQKYYGSTVWGKVVNDLRQKAQVRGYTDWKKFCSEPAPWLDRKLKEQFSNQYQKMISGITTCLSE